VQERKIERVGGSRTIPVDVRVVAASNVDLASEVRAGRFRQDLYFRLCVFPIVIPPLRERRDDIPLLTEHFLRLFRARHRRDVTGFTRRAIDALLAYDFPGNIRELQNLVERGVVYANEGGQIDIQHLFTGFEKTPALGMHLTDEGRIEAETVGGPVVVAPVSVRPATMQSPQDLKAMELSLYEGALREAGGNVSAAARKLGVTRASLEYRLKRNGLL
jgi:transcriptional regulator with GAF, ATPase, and Fis domain